MGGGDSKACDSGPHGAWKPASSKPNILLFFRRLCPATAGPAPPPGHAAPGSGPARAHRHPCHVAAAVIAPAASDPIACTDSNRYGSDPMTPKEIKLGFEPAALKRSYSPRNAQLPRVHCTPAPAANPVVVRSRARLR